MTEEKRVKAYLQNGEKKDYDYDKNPTVESRDGSYYINFSDGNQVILPMEIVEEIHIFKD